MRSAAGDTGRHGHARWLGAAAEFLPLATHSVDAVWTSFTAHYLDLPAAAAEFRRVVTTGGRVLVWHAFPEVFDSLEWFRWFPSARAIDEERMPSQTEVVSVFENIGLACVSQSVHRKLIEPDLASLADRLSHRSISTLRLISDAEFTDGLARLRQHAAAVPAEPVYSDNVLLVFAPRG